MATADRLLYSALHGTAWRRATQRGSIGAAVAELQQIAGGRCDILAEAAGMSAGSWSVQAGSCVGTELMTSGLLIYAGADLREIQAWVDLGRERASRGRGPIHG